MWPTWVLSAPDGPHDGPMNLAIRVGTVEMSGTQVLSLIIALRTEKMDVWRMPPSYSTFSRKLDGVLKCALECLTSFWHFSAHLDAPWGCSMVLKYLILIPVGAKRPWWDIYPQATGAGNGSDKYWPCVPRPAIIMKKSLEFPLGVSVISEFWNVWFYLIIIVRVQMCLPNHRLSGEIGCVDNIIWGCDAWSWCEVLQHKRHGPLVRGLWLLRGWRLYVLLTLIPRTGYLEGVFDRCTDVKGDYFKSAFFEYERRWSCVQNNFRHILCLLELNNFHCSFNELSSVSLHAINFIKGQVVA